MHIPMQRFALDKREGRPQRLGELSWATALSISEHSRAAVIYTPASALLSLSYHADIIKVVSCALGVRNGSSMPACTGLVKCYTGASWSKQKFHPKFEGTESKLRCFETILPVRSSKQCTQVQALVRWLVSRI